jgi:putative flippase GtrA
MMIQIQKMIRYMLAGGVGALLNFAIYFSLIKFSSTWYILASVISFTLSIVVGFYLQKYFTFQDKKTDSIDKQVFYFFVFAVMNLLINILLLAFLVEFLRLDKILAKVCVLGFLAIWSFFVYQNFIFKKI